MLSSIWTTPSLPTLSIAVAINLPTSGSLLADIVAICSNWSSEVMSSDKPDWRDSTTDFTALSIPLFISTAFSPLSKDLRPNLTISLAKSVDVVVPSPALSAVLIAACFTNWTPVSSIGSLKSMFLATVTPSLVDLTTSPGFEITTFLPLGPKVQTTESAKVSIPLTNLSLPSFPNSIIFAISLFFNFC